jgi:hypothetical protein
VGVLLPDQLSRPLLTAATAPTASPKLLENHTYEMFRGTQTSDDERQLFFEMSSFLHKRVNSSLSRRSS